MSFWDFITSRDPLSLITATLMLVFLIHKGIVVCPWINWSKKKKKSHASCELYVDFQQALYNAREIASAPYKLVRDQMVVAEDIGDHIRNLLFKHFLVLLQEHKDGEKLGLTTDPETQTYTLALDYTMLLVKQKVRFFMQENHLADMTEVEFMVKVKERTAQILTIFSEEMNECYPRLLSLSREEVYDHNMEIVHIIEELLQDMFVKARILSIENKAYLLSITQSEFVK